MLNVKKLLTNMITYMKPGWNMGTTDLNGGVKLFNFSIQWGTNTQSVSSSSAVNWNTTFGWSHAYKPVVFAQVVDTQSPNTFSVVVNNITTTGCTFRRSSTVSTAYNCTIVWVAIGMAA